MDVLDEKNIIKDPIRPLTYGEIFQPDQNVFTTAMARDSLPPASEPKKDTVVEGTLRVVDGYIGGAQGWIIKAGLLKSEGIGLATVKGDATWAFWAGNDSPASAEFRVSHTGDLVATSATITGSITATSGRIANWYINTNTLSSGAVEASSNVLIDSANSLIRLGPTSGNYVTLDGANLRIRSSNYSAGVAGFTIEPTLIEAENLVARATLKGATFQYDVVSAVGGQLMIANADTLASDMTALDSATLTIKGNTTFAVNDILVIRAVTSSGIQEEWLRVTSTASAPTYSVTRDLAASFSSNNNPTWQAGTTVVKQGKSDGSSTYSGGWLRLFGEGTNSPFYSVYSRTGIAYNSYSERVRIGNLNGHNSFASDTFGISIGDKTTGKYLTYDDASGDLIVNDSNLSFSPFFGDGSDGDVTISADTSLSSDMYYDDLTIQTTFTLNTNGYRVFVKGTLTFEGTGKIAVNGGAGGAGGNGNSSAQGGTAGTAGTIAHASGSLPPGEDGKAGGAGGGTGAGGSCENGSNGTAGDAATKAIAGAGSAGGDGGDGSNGCTGNGTAGAAGAVSGTVFNKVRNIVSAFQLLDNFPSVTALATASGSGSGGGGSSGRNGNNTTSGGGGGGGGSGATGGITWVAAKKIVTVDGNSYLEAKGGAGGAGGTGGQGAIGGGSTGDGGGGGGGGGGRGGVVILMYSKKTGTGTTSVAGGSAGAPGAAGGGGGVAGAAGTAGGSGSLIELVV